MSLTWPPMLLTLAVVPMLVAAYVHRFQGQRNGAGLGGLRLTPRSTQQSAWRRHLPIGIMTSAVAVLAFSAARPHLVLDLPTREGTVILAFDTSNSMRADDAVPTRLDAAKELARTFVEAQPGDVQVGVVTFSSGGLIVQPPTDDQELILEAIDRVGTEGTTSLGRGIFTAIDAIEPEPLALGDDDEPIPDDVSTIDIGYFGSAVVILLTDGENTVEPNPIEIAALASNAGVRVFPVGIGTPAGAVVELEEYSVFTALDETMLREIAEITDGDYIAGPGVGGEADLTELYDAVDRELSVEGEATEITGILAGAAAVLLLLGSVLSMAWLGRAP